ncbi:ATP-binding cassette domain-containing protein [Bifidobacterium sp. SMB2]|uniref:ATP-binding cassette domain-containing protein n=1 Tax=Bifidobacterium saimiriisciurei TaxID=2661627 RepID=A0ABX0C9C2_9BIFI|nr:MULTISPECIES: ABC transporter ATP-binding protein/permease [Bifidobacterium]NEG95891.1 ATP-binding cassette domain-containing protein [Bifidobacterium sp. SMB2]NEH11738.1 ATP-binding cassette domain-containing protein [Bifidobacterium saimiriisciurei]
MLQITSISKQYKTGDFIQKALDDVSLNLRDSEFVAILGPSGSGKTTLLNIIGGLDRYDSGDLVINGISTKRYKDRDWDSYRNHTIGFVFQSYNLIPHQSILSNVELALTISGIPKSERRERARKALEQVGLGDHVDKRPNQLSGGQMQRVAIARALVNNPSIVLADEPTGALDSDTSVQIMDLLRDVARDRLVVMVTHNPELAEQYATRIVELRDGTIRSDSDPFEPEPESDAAVKPAVHRTMGRASMSFATSLALSFNNLGTKKARTILTSFAGSIGIIGIALILSISTGVNTYITNIQRDTMTSYPIEIQSQSFDMSSIMKSQMSDTEEGRSASAKTDGIYPDDSGIKQVTSLTSSITKNNLSKFKKYLDDPNSEIHKYVGANGIQYTYDVKFSVYDRDPKGTLVNADGVTVGKSSDTAMSSKMASLGAQSSQNMADIQRTQMSMITGKTDENTAPDSFNEIMPGAKNNQRISKVITDNYEVVKGSWPKARDQVVLVLDQNNKVSLTTLYELGLLPASDYNDMMTKINDGKDVKTDTGRIDYDKALDQTLRLVPAADQYVKNADGTYRYVGDDADEVAKLADKAMKLKIVGVVRPHADSKTTPLAAGIGYTRDLTNYLIDYANNSAIVKAQKASPKRNVLNDLAFSPADDNAKAADAKTYVAGLGVSDKAVMARSMLGDSASGASAGSATSANGASAYGTAGASGAAGASAAMGTMSEQQLADQFDAYIATAPTSALVKIYDQYVSSGDYDDNLAAFGVVGRDAPTAISIYTDSFDDKNAVGDAISHYNDGVKKADKIVYNDYVGLMMNSVTTIINVISYVLMAFVSVSLIVSSIMIGIITYISVLERTKEIGILRAMGASKRNISQVFNAETGIIGLLAGLIGIGVTLLLLIPGNQLLHHLIGNNDVNAVLPVGGGVILVVLSVVLTLIGGLIPSKKAARQDPATALRTE